MGRLKLKVYLSSSSAAASAVEQQARMRRHIDSRIAGQSRVVGFLTICREKNIWLNYNSEAHSLVAVRIVPVVKVILELKFIFLPQNGLQDQLRRIL